MNGLILTFFLILRCFVFVFTVTDVSVEKEEDSGDSKANNEATGMCFYSISNLCLICLWFVSTTEIQDTITLSREDFYDCRVATLTLTPTHCTESPAVRSMRCKFPSNHKQCMILKCF